ncbi:beta-lactamase-like protein [Mycena filopes]|nr:beta-lactamase-like protein [Mycena filopes]
MHLLPTLALLFCAAETYASYRDFGIPASGATVQVRAFNVVNATFVNKPGFSVFEPVLPGREAILFPVFAFLVEHNTSRFMFDLGIRPDPLNLAPVAAGLFTDGIILTETNVGIVDLLQDGGIALESIDEVLWSHSHFDHIGDMSKFPNTTRLVIGSETDTATFPQFPNATLLASDFANREVKKIDFSAANLSFANLKAIDYFGDGSFYLLNTPGHLPGHLSALARVTPTSFVHLGGDTYHNPAEFRPRPELQKNFPCPTELIDEARRAISTDFFWSAKSRDGVFDLPSRTDPFLVASDLPGSFTADSVTAEVSVAKVGAFDADPDFFVVVAHDTSLRDEIPYFPATLNNWKAQGLKEKTLWNFVDSTNPSFVLSPINQTSQ